jgi:hypothetical protein
MQQGRPGYEPVYMCQIEPDLIDHVDFMFKQDNDKNCDIKIMKTYPGDDGIYIDENGAFQVPFTAEETYMFKERKLLYLSVRPVLVDGSIPEVPTVAIRMHSTLYNEEE